MKKKLFILALFILSFNVSFAQDNTAYKTALSKMMEASGAHAIYKSVIGQMVSMMKEQKANVPDQLWKDLEIELTKISINELTDMLVPVYQNHLSIGDINELTRFYSTPVGKKFAEKSPFIVQESMKVGQQWGQKIGQQVADKLKDKGY